MADTTTSTKGDGGATIRTYPEVFTTVPPPVKETKPGQIGQEHVRQFFEEGYTIVTDYFSPEELQPCRDACAELVEELAQKLYKAGKIDRLYEEFGLFQRLTEIEKAWPGASILLFKQGKLPQAIMDLWGCEKFLNMAEQFIGPEVAGHPTWNLRIKPPNHSISVVPWHQDSAYFSADSYDHVVLTAWVPMLDTGAHNGGMQVVKNAQRLGKMAQHTCCPGDTWFVDLSEEEITKSLGANMKEDIVTCNVPFGGFLLFNNITPHRSLPNTSNDVRWSMDLRWQSPKENWGFYDIAEGILFRDPAQPDLKPNWEKFLSINRKAVWQERHYKKVMEADPFDTTVTGPWIGRWPITHHNRHTKVFQLGAGSS